MNDLSQKRELHEAAKALLDDKAFTEAIKGLRKLWFDELMTAADTAERKLELVAKIKALEAIPGSLQAIMGDYAKALNRVRGAHA